MLRILLAATGLMVAAVQPLWAQDQSQQPAILGNGQPYTATAAPSGPTTGPWTSGNPGNSSSTCQPGEYTIGVEVIGSSPGTKYCVGCVARLRVICQHLP